jgi:hypothetical protein
MSGYATAMMTLADFSAHEWLVQKPFTPDALARDGLLHIIHAPSRQSGARST